MEIFDNDLHNYLNTIECDNNKCTCNDWSIDLEEDIIIFTALDGEVFYKPLNEIYDYERMSYICDECDKEISLD